MCRALTNLVGNGVATIVIAGEGELDVNELKAAMAHPITLGEALEEKPV